MSNKQLPADVQEWKMTLADHEQIIALQLKNMSLEDAIFNVAYEKGKKEAHPGIGWVKGAPKEMKPHYAVVPSKLYDHITYKAIVIPKDTPGYWWAVGDGFAFALTSEEIIEYLDESGTAAAPSTGAMIYPDLEAEAKEHAKIITNNPEHQLYVAQGYYNGVAKMRRSIVSLPAGRQEAPPTTSN